VVVSGCAPALLRDWDFLQSDVIPPLLTDPSRSPTAWSIGCVDDAVALAVAFRHGQRSGTSHLDVYASEPSPGRGEMGFGLADLRRVPTLRQSDCLIRQDRRWVAADQLAEHVFLTNPTAPVDLVAVRPTEDKCDVLLDEAVDQLRPGGQLLLITRQPDYETAVPAGLTAIGANGSGQVYRKCEQTRSRVRSATNCRIEQRPETLARRRAEDELVTNHVRLARSLARRFAHHGEPADDLEQVAMLALLKAAKRFDPDRNIQFATYATSSILGELKRHFRDKTWMLRVPRTVQELYLSVKHTRDELTHELSETPTVAQIAARLDVSELAVLDAIRAGDDLRPASLDGWFGDDGGTEVPIIDGSFDQCLDRLQVQASLPNLDDRERLVLKRVYFDGLTQSDVAVELEVSQMQVSRLLAQAVAKLRR